MSFWRLLSGTDENPGVPSSARAPGGTELSIFAIVFFTTENLRRLLEDCSFETSDVERFSLEYSPFTTLQNLLDALPGKPERFHRALTRNAEAETLRGEPATWIHAAQAVAISPAAFVLSPFGHLLAVGNTMRFHCRRTVTPAAIG